MQQRTYHGGIDAEALADYLIAHYTGVQGLPSNSVHITDQKIQAQKIGKDGSFIVQVGHGDNPLDMRHIVVTVAITSSREEEGGIVVTIGQRTWLTADELTNAALWALLGMLITPLALFGLLWPLSEVLRDAKLPEDIWNTIDIYAASVGASTTDILPLTHPHLGL